VYTVQKPGAHPGNARDVTRLGTGRERQLTAIRLHDTAAASTDIALSRCGRHAGLLRPAGDVTHKPWKQSAVRHNDGRTASSVAAAEAAAAAAAECANH